MTDTETIVAVSTARGYSARAVVRLSGPGALGAVGERFRADDRDWRRTFSVTDGLLRLPSEDLDVPALVYVMRAPRSYTREDVVELHVPGSPALLDMILDDLTSSGALRLARPGEFTQRAFLNGRIDLAQAEAVLAVIRARSESELLAAESRLAGRVSDYCADLQDDVSELRALTEAALDFADHDVELMPADDYLARAAALCARLDAELAGGRDAAASDGRIHVVVCGPPNAGKSSLLNRLAGREVAIVHETPGTTRDPVQGEVEVHGVWFGVTDTAGIRPAPDEIETEAVARSRALARAAQLVVLVVDGSQPLRDDDLALAAELPAARVLCVVNKCDLPGAVDGAALGALAGELVHASALTGQGMDELRDALGRVVFEGRLDASAADCLLNARQREAARRARERVAESMDAVEAGLGYEFAALHLREAADALAELTGRVTGDDVLDRIFSRFCIGK